MRTCLPKSLWRLYSKNSLKKSMPNKFQQKPLPKKYWKKTFLPQTLWGEISTKQFSKETSPKYIWWKNLPKKHSTKKYLKIQFDPSMSEEKLATKQSVKASCLPNKLWIEISSRQIPEETSTKEYLEEHAYQKKTKESWKFFRLHLPKPFRQKTFETSLWRKNPDRKLSKPKIL